MGQHLSLLTPDLKRHVIFQDPALKTPSARVGGKPVTSKESTTSNKNTPNGADTAENAALTEQKSIPPSLNPTQRGESKAITLQQTQKSELGCKTQKTQTPTVAPSKLDPTQKDPVIQIKMPKPHIPKHFPPASPPPKTPPATTGTVLAGNQMPGDPFLLPSKLRDVVNPDDSKYDTLLMMPGTDSQIFQPKTQKETSGYENASVLNSLNLDTVKTTPRKAHEMTDDVAAQKKKEKAPATKQPSASIVSGLDDLYGPKSVPATLSWLGPSNLPPQPGDTKSDNSRSIKSEVKSTGRK